MDDWQKKVIQDTYNILVNNVTCDPLIPILHTKGCLPQNFIDEHQTRLTRPNGERMQHLLAAVQRKPAFQQFLDALLETNHKEVVEKLYCSLAWDDNAMKRQDVRGMTNKEHYTKKTASLPRPKILNENNTIYQGKNVNVVVQQTRSTPSANNGRNYKRLVEKRKEFNQSAGRIRRAQSGNDVRFFCTQGSATESQTHSDQSDGDTPTLGKSARYSQPDLTSAALEAAREKLHDYSGNRETMGGFENINHSSTNLTGGSQQNLGLNQQLSVDSQNRTSGSFEAGTGSGSSNRASPATYGSDDVNSFNNRGVYGIGNFVGANGNDPLQKGMTGDNQPQENLTGLGIQPLINGSPGLPIIVGATAHETMGPSVATQHFTGGCESTMGKGSYNQTSFAGYGISAMKYDNNAAYYGPNVAANLGDITQYMHAMGLGMQNSNSFQDSTTGGGIQSMISGSPGLPNILGPAQGAMGCGQGTPIAPRAMGSANLPSMMANSSYNSASLGGYDSGAMNNFNSAGYAAGYQNDSVPGPSRNLPMDKYGTVKSSYPYNRTSVLPNQGLPHSLGTTAGSESNTSIDSQASSVASESSTHLDRFKKTMRSVRKRMKKTKTGGSEKLDQPSTTSTETPRRDVKIEPQSSIDESAEQWPPTMPPFANPGSNSPVSDREFELQLHIMRLKKTIQDLLMKQSYEKNQANEWKCRIEMQTNDINYLQQELKDKRDQLERQNVEISRQKEELFRKDARIGELQTQRSYQWKWPFQY